MKICQKLVRARKNLGDRPVVVKQPPAAEVAGEVHGRHWLATQVAQNAKKPVRQH
jgi:hypothetical protein